MKKIFVIFSISMISMIGISQRYTPFDLLNGEWHTSYGGRNGVFVSYGYTHVWEDVTFYCKSDTIINDTLYQKLYYNDNYTTESMAQANISGYIGAIRNDSINKRVWFRNAFYNGILYDFNLNVGDSIKYFHHEGPFSMILKSKINTIDSVLNCNTFYKRYNYMGVYETESITEGIGQSDGLIPINFISPYTYSTSDGVNCYSEKNNNSCALCTPPYTAIKELEISKLKIYPNPTNETINILSEVPMLSIEITDLLGKLIYKKSDINNEKTEIKIQQNGVYLIKINISDKIIIRKIIKK
jgi:hypothetical protein